MCASTDFAGRFACAPLPGLAGKIDAVLAQQGGKFFGKAVASVYQQGRERRIVVVPAPTPACGQPVLAMQVENQVSADTAYALFRQRVYKGLQVCLVKQRVKAGAHV